ncbi:MAG: DUF1178 family protein [Burkholderiaceae bacterium]|nr:DUF1178 family protein [Burkholderiaceae bacterium]
MKVFDLGCENGHSFEGWFASAADFDEQCTSGLLECPICSSKSVRKTLSAPRLNLKHATEPPAADTAKAAGTPADNRLLALWMSAARHLVANTEDVGDRFAEEARRIHYQEAPERGIRGVATQEESAALAEEGIEVFSFPMPASHKEPMQ